MKVEEFSVHWIYYWVCVGNYDDDEDDDDDHEDDHDEDDDDVGA